jgi:S-adenosylmethionine:tRNA ribosyltransferase-isomerase
MNTPFEATAIRLADRPAHHRGLPRDGVRLLVASTAGVAHSSFRELGSFLQAGDLVVFNTSATLPSAIQARRSDGSQLPIHVSTTVDDGSWVLELRLADGSGPDESGRPGELLTLPGGHVAKLLAPYRAQPGGRRRLWQAEITPSVLAADYLPQHGRPIEYPYLADQYQLAEHQTIFARHPGSAEMPSAGAPFTAELVVQLLTQSIRLAPITLHCQVSSPESSEPPLPEWFEVPDTTAALVQQTRAAGGAVIAVGTTVCRALESAADSTGVVHAQRGWTELVVTTDRPPRVVTGLVSGLHEPQASHLLLLEAVAGPELVRSAYEAALADGEYLWHEFGDSMLFLP